ncbi:3-hydroxy-5-methyl-1-naphthoate 3-O-methyltransferase [Diplonema papillatum]|nr:3-hydroxy-5-methyl-1-naphthoate 3-O-methyltransferase [Diplonema papillatum]
MLSRIVARAAARSSATNNKVVRQLRRASDIPEVDIDKIAYGFMASQSLFAGLELGIFDHIAKKEEGLGLAALQDATGVTQPRLQTLLTALTAHGMLRRSDGGVYTLTPPVAQYLVEGAKHYYGDYLKFQIGRQFYQRLHDLGTTMVTGEAPTYSDWFSNPEQARMYTMAQHNGSLATAKHINKKVDLSGVRKLLDVGGGSGAFSIVMARRNAELASTILELPQVAETGRSIVAKEEESVAKRIEYKSGTALVDWPVDFGDFDCVLMSYLSGSVPADLLLPLYQQAYKALAPGGKLIVHDFMVDDSLDGPPVASLWAVQHIAVNVNGLGLCPANVSEVMKEAGFEDVAPSQEMIKGLTKLVIATKKA